MNKVIICGLGALGLTYAVKLQGRCDDLRILVDEERLQRYKINPPVFNGVKKSFNYILPTDKLSADLIIISTKSAGLASAIANIKNFVTPDTRIISLLNGITSEEKIAEVYPEAKIIKSYFIGHSAVRFGNEVTQDGIGKIVTESDEKLEKFLSDAGIDYSVAEDINYSVWLKYLLNLFSNQTSAILNMTFGEMKNSKSFKLFAEKIIDEVVPIANAMGVKYTEKLKNDAINSLSLACDDGKTSMLQDILSKRKTEVDILAGEVIKLGEKYNIPTPYNRALYDLIKIKEEQNEYSIHSR